MRRKCKRNTKWFRLKDKKIIRKNANVCVLKNTMHAWHGPAVRKLDKLRKKEKENATKKGWNVKQIVKIINGQQNNKL